MGSVLTVSEKNGLSDCEVTDLYINLSLPDTSVWVHYFRRPVRPRLQLRIQELTVSDSLATCDVVRLELLRGARDDDEFTRIDRLLNAARRLPTGDREWEEAIRLGYRLKRVGVAVSVTDLLVAVVAMTYNVILVHADDGFEQMRPHCNLITEPAFNLL